ncbi:MAG: LPP20 family lipoprotein [bacterium]
MKKANGVSRLLLFGLMLVIAGTGLLISGCQKSIDSSGRPAWTQNFEKKYPANEYFTSLGTGTTVGRAKENAKAGIAQIISQQISDVRSRQERSRETFGDDGKFMKEVERQRDMQISTDEKVSGIEIVESHEDFQTGNNYALAVLDRERAARTYRRKFEDSQRSATQYYRRARAADYKLDKLSFLSQALPAAAEATRLANHLNVISPKKELGLDVDPGPATINSELQSLLADINVYVRKMELTDNIFSGSELETAMQSWIRAAFTDLDFHVADRENNADLIAEGQLDATTEKRGLGSAINWHITLDLRKPGGNKFGTVSYTGSSGGINRKDMVLNARADMENWVRSNMKTLITEKILTADK